jgi:HTH-type transcriptional regulator/antitoxin HigA
MTLKPIRNADDLVSAQQWLASLIQGNGRGQHDDEIEVVATLIEDYERRTFVFDAPDPVSAIRFRMTELGLAPRQLEPYIGSRARVSEVMTGKRSLSMDMIRSLHDGLGIPYASLMSGHQRHVRVQATRPALQSLRSLGFNINAKDLPSFLSIAPQSSPALLRRSQSARAASKTDASALMLWQAAVLKVANTRSPRVPFNAATLDDQFFRSIARLSVRDDGPLAVIEQLKGRGVELVVMPPLPGTFLDGAALFSPQEVPIVALTLRYDRLDNFWFTLMHELAHLRLHFNESHGKDFVFFDDMDIQSSDKQEREADAVAQQCLIPDAALQSARWDAASSTDDIHAVATRARVHVSVAAGRWQRDNQNYRKFARLIERSSLRAQLLPASSGVSAASVKS